MSITLIVILVAIALATIVVAAVVFKRLPKKINKSKFVHDWREIQGLCRDKSRWIEALAHADELLYKALRRRKFKGKSMGEKLVSAQRLFSNNDSVWTAHNLHKRLVAKPGSRLQEGTVKKALVAYRQALIDLGALPNGKPNI